MNLPEKLAKRFNNLSIKYDVDGTSNWHAYEDGFHDCFKELERQINALRIIATEDYIHPGTAKHIAKKVLNEIGLK